MKYQYYLVPLFVLLQSACTPYYPSMTATAVATSTPTPIESSPTYSPTLTPEPSATLTPRPTLEPAQAEETIRTLLSEPVDCAAPCVWGIKPGITTIEEAREIASHLGLPLQFTLEEDGKRFFAITHDPEGGPSIHIILTTEDGIVQNLTVSIIPGEQRAGVPREWSAYSPETLISRYGPPSRVEFFVDWGPRPVYAMTSHFDKVDLIVDYVGYGIIGGTVSAPQVCPLTDEFDIARLWMGERPINPPDRGVPLEKATSMTIEEFSSLMMGAPDQGCFTLNKEYFP